MEGYKMRLYRAKDYNDMSRKAAHIISAQVIMKPDCVLGLDVYKRQVRIIHYMIMVNNF